jgi:ATP-dependent Clp protease protease subunit
MGAYLPLPHVYEREGRQERSWDIYSRLLRDRIVFIGTPIDDFVANSIIAQLLFLQMEDPKKDIHVVPSTPSQLNSPPSNTAVPKSSDPELDEDVPF